MCWSNGSLFLRSHSKSPNSGFKGSFWCHERYSGYIYTSLGDSPGLLGSKVAVVGGLGVWLLNVAENNLLFLSVGLLVCRFLFSFTAYVFMDLLQIRSHSINL